MLRAEARNIILSLQGLINGSSMAHQWLINGSSMAHQWLINGSSMAHLLSFGSSSLLAHLLLALLRSSQVSWGFFPRAMWFLPRTARVRMLFCAVYLTAGAFLSDITARLLLLHSTVHRLTAAKLGTRVRQSAQADI
jgi:hypothetical protein